jgi:hypothetical protein
LFRHKGGILHGKQLLVDVLLWLVFIGGAFTKVG